LLNYVVLGEPFNSKMAGVGGIVLRAIEKEESNRLQRDGVQGMQDGAWMDEAADGSMQVVNTN